MLIRGDARALPLRDGCVSCVVTSPPYWGLRDYGVLSQIGLEPTPDGYVAALIAVFREVRRVLRDEGTVWLNLGDSYAGSGDSGGSRGKNSVAFFYNRPTQNVCARSTLKPKDLVGIPWRVAFALQADGWYLRSDIIWSKPNPMPESVTDRPTKAHEYVFLLAKSARYYYNAEAIKESYAESTRKEFLHGYHGSATKAYTAAGVQDPSAVKARILRRDRKDNGTSKAATLEASGFVDGVSWCGLGDLRGANKRSVWQVATMPYAGAHFATMPEALVEPCILAGCPPSGLVLDPFCGTGTVLAVAARMDRHAIGLDLTYQSLARTRTAQRGLRFSAVEVMP